MALQASGAIKYSEIETEFGRSYSTIGENWTRVFGPAYDDSYFEIYNDYDIASDNYVKLPGTWNVLFPFGLYAGLGHYVQSESTYTTTYGPAYVEGQNYTRFFQGVWTVFYGGVELGDFDGAYLTIGTTRYSGGNIIVDNGNSWANPDYYQLTVEELVDTYKYYESFVEVGSTTTPGSTITVGNKRYTMGSQIYTTIKYNIQIEEFGPDETTGTYSFYYGSLKGTATAPNNSVTETSTFGNTRYRVGEIQTTDSTAAYYKIIVEKNPKSYVRLYEGIFTVVYEGIEYGQYTGAYLYVNQYRFSGGNLVVDNGNQFQNPNFYQLTVDETEVKWGLGDYRMDDSSTYGGIKMPLDYLAGALKDTDIPFKPDPIKFSNFYNSRLNVIVDYYSNPTIPENRPENGTTRYTDPSRTTVVGQFLQRPVSTTGKAVRMVIGKDIGCVNGVVEEDKNKCAIRTGSAWNTDTKLRIDVGPAGRILGGGGKGGKGHHQEKQDDSNFPDGKGRDATSALGIEYEGTDNTMVSVVSGGMIRGGFGGGGGGGCAYESEGPRFLGRSTEIYITVGGGGGGGAGLPFGSGGIKGDRDPAYGCGAGYSYPCTGTDGDDGTINGAGEGGEGVTGVSDMVGGDGGDGGSPGELADHGIAASGGGKGNSLGGGFGADGAAIRRTGGLTLTITNNGTITGDQTATGVA